MDSKTPGWKFTEEGDIFPSVKKNGIDLEDNVLTNWPT